MRFQHVGHLVVGGGPDRGHRGLGLLVGLDPDLVDPVRHVLLLRRLQAGSQRVIKHHPLLGIRLQLVDQHQLRRRLILQRIDPGLALLDVPLQRLRLRQLNLLFLHQPVVLGVEGGKLRLQLGPRRRVLLDRNLVLQLDQLGVHAGDLGAHRFQRKDGFFAFGQRAGKVVLHPGLLHIQQIQLPLQQLHDHVRLRDQVLQLVIHRGRAHPFLPHRICLGSGEDADEAFHPGFRPHLGKLGRKTRRHIVQPHDQFRDVRVHQVGVLVHIVQRGVFHIQRDALVKLRPRSLDPAGNRRNLRLCLGDLSLTFLDLRVEIGHRALH